MEEPYCGEDRDQEVVVRKVGVDCAIEWERRGVRVERVVRRRAVINRSGTEPCEELVDIADALDGPESIAISARR